MPTTSYSPFKTYTDNPFVDLLIYYSKLLAFGAVIKNGKNASDEETIDSVTNGDTMIACTEGSAIFALFDYTEEELKEVGITDKKQIQDCINDKFKIPSSYRDEITKIGTRDFLANYVEYNNYYRMVCGLPDIGDYGIPVRDYEYLMPDGNIWGATYIHEIGTEGCTVLENEGVLDIIRNDYPTKSYLNYLTCGITPYKVRKAYDFQILYLPEVDDDIIKDRFEDTYEDNRLYVMNTFYTEAFKLTSKYYDNFIGLIIMLLTITDIVSEVQQDIIKKDILDERCVQFIFEMYGVTYYKSIPLKYQKRICKNLNLLIKDKSSAQCMFDLISIFGATSLTVFKYFLLKDRNLDKYGDYIYNQVIKKTSKVNDTVMVDDADVTKESNTITIPFPFDHFLEKGNKMLVWGDGDKLREGTDYKIEDYDQLILISDKAKNSATIHFDFYYDKRTISDYIIDTENSVHVDIKQVTLKDSNVIKYTLPYSKYLLDGNDIIISLGGTWIDKKFYTINQAKSTITLDAKFDTTGTRNVFVIFIYGTKLVTKYIKTDVVATIDNQKTFNVPEPFKNYITEGNSFFITSGITFISNDRYKIDGTKITFTDTYNVKKGRAISFNFVYSLKSIYTPIEIKTMSETITATSAYQYKFDIHPPINNFLSSGYKVYCKVRGAYLEQDMFDVYYNTLAFRTQSIGLQPGEEMEVLYVYGPFDEITGINELNIKIDRQYVVATQNDQTTFTGITFPTENYFDRGGKVIVDIYGVYCEPDTDYIINESTKTLTLKNEHKLPVADVKINLTFLYNVESEYTVKADEYHLKVTKDGQTEFPVTLPFYPYYETGNGYIVIYDSLIINPNDVTLNEKSITIRNIKTVKDKTIIVLFVYNNKYVINAENVITIEEKTVHVADEVTNDLNIPIPTPFEDYIEHGWPYVVDINGKKLSTDKYYDIDNKFSFTDINQISKTEDITFTFAYINNSDFVITEDGEDNLLDFELKFIGVPLDNETIYHHNQYIMAKQNVLPYDTTTLADQFWDGVGSDENLVNNHERVKLEIINKKFNYERTKYFGLNRVFDIAEMSFQIAYFYNLIFDDWLKEEELVFNLPNIEAGYKFKIGHIFCYLISLSYLYQGIEDTIVDIPNNITYVKGFNMHADLDALKKYILKQRRLPGDYDVWDFEIPLEQLKSMNDFKDLYVQNREIYYKIVNAMYHCRNHDIYIIWKKLYDSMVIWEYNQEYFKLSNGEVAETFRDFLQEKCPPLYRDIIKLDNTSDPDALKMSIIDRVDDVVYLLEQYFDSSEFEHIYDKFPGVSQEALMNYVYTMITFFKSYKIVLRSKGDYIEFSLKDPSLTAINVTDSMEMNVRLDKLDYIYLDERPSKGIATIKDDKIGLKEKVIFETKYGSEGDICNVQIVQSDHQQITVYCNDIPYTEDFTCSYGSEIYSYITADKGYIAGTLNYPYKKVREDIVVEASPATVLTYKVSIIQTEHQTIYVTANRNNTYTSDFTVVAGSQITVDVQANIGYIAGTPIFTAAIVNEDVVVYASEAEEKRCNVVISNPQNQTINMIIYSDEYPNGYRKFSNGDTVTVSAGVRYEINIVPENGYFAGSLIGYEDSGYINDDMNIKVTEATRKMVNVYIIQSTHQTIKVTIDGVTYTDSYFTIPLYSIYSASVEADKNYEAGELNQSLNGIIDADIIFSATEPKLVAVELNVNGTISVEGLTITDITDDDIWFEITVDDQTNTWHYELNSTEWIPSDENKTIEIKPGASVLVKFHVSEKIQALTTLQLNFSDGNQQELIVSEDGYVTVNLIITTKVCTVYVAPTTNQTITITFGDGQSLKSNSKTTDEVDVDAGTTFEAVVKSNLPLLYKAGDLTMSVINDDDE